MKNLPNLSELILCLIFFFGVSYCGDRQDRTDPPTPNLNPAVDNNRTPLSSGTVTATFTGTATDTNTSTENVTETELSIPSLGAKLHAVLRTVPDSNGSLMIFFHSENSNLHESDLVASRLNALQMNTLAVDLRIGGTQFGHDNVTVEDNASDTSFMTLVADLHSTVQWASTKYSTVYATGSSNSAAALIKEARTNSVIVKFAVFSPPSYIEGEAIYDYVGQIFKAFLAAAPLSEKSTMDSVLNAALSQYLVRSTDQVGDHGLALLSNTVVQERYLSFFGLVN